MSCEVPAVGLEPTTLDLKGRYSTTELREHGHSIACHVNILVRPRRGRLIVELTPLHLGYCTLPSQKVVYSIIELQAHRI